MMPAALASVGCFFDPDDPLHQWQDVLRWAQWIQAARDRGDYAEADRVRTLAVNCGAIVRMNKTETLVIEDMSAHTPHWPDFSGYAEWVHPDRLNGRHVLDYCYEMGSMDIAEVRVANWRDHPNLQQARDEGWPDTLWTHSGQAAMESTTDIYWTFAQFDALDRAATEMAISREWARLRAESEVK